MVILGETAGGGREKPQDEDDDDYTARSRRKVSAEMTGTGQGRPARPVERSGVVVRLGSVLIAVAAAVISVPEAAARGVAPREVATREVALREAAQRKAAPRALGQGAPDCDGPDVLLVHDLAETVDSWDPLAADLERAGWCPVRHGWGNPRPGDVPLPVGGLTGVESAAMDLAVARAWLPTEPDRAESGPSVGVHARAGDDVVVAKGVGALVVQRALQLATTGTAPDSDPDPYSHAATQPGPDSRAAGRVRHLITLGPVWNGTNVLGIADVEGLSRDLGTFEAILAWEKTWMDPLCEGCREAVRGSELLETLHREGIRRPGVEYTDIATATDLLIHPPLEQSSPPVALHVVPPPDGGLPVWHGELGRDPASRALVLDVLEAT